MKIKEIATILKDKAPEISDNLEKLSESTEYKELISKAGTIGALIDVCFTIFTKIRNSLKSQEEIHFNVLIRIVFESLKESTPSKIIDSSKDKMDLEEIFHLFAANYDQNYYHLPDHPSIKKFKEKIIALMIENNARDEVQKFSVKFNLSIIRKAKNQPELKELLENWKLNTADDNLIEYLEFLTTLLDEPSPVDNIPVGQYYVESEKVLIDYKSWEVNYRNISMFNSEPWNIQDFINGNKRRIIIGSEFGNGKTNYLKKAAVDYANMYLRGSGSFIPIFVPLKRKLNNIFNDESLEDISKLAKGQNILLLCDSLDEYEGDKTTLIYDRLPKIFDDHTVVKTIITTRLEPDLPNKLNAVGEKYVRLLPFDRDRVNEFFSRSKYNLPEVTYESLKEYGLDESEIAKPLLCWMFAIMYSNSNEHRNIRNVKNMNIKRVLFFQEVTHSIIKGKYRKDSHNYDLESSYKKEKKMLRNIAFLYSVYKYKLTTEMIQDKLGIKEDEIFTNPIITSYFNFTTTTDNPKRIEFFHTSFFEYLLAEAFIERLTSGQIYALDSGLPSLETMIFFEGLLQIMNESDESKITLRLVESLKEDNISVTKLKNTILSYAKQYSEEEISISSFQKQDNIEYKNMYVHRWISIFVINILEPSFQLDREKFFELLKLTSNFMPLHLQRIENIDLSKSNIKGENIGSNANLSNANLQYSVLSGTFNGTKFTGTDLTGSTLEYKGNFNDVDFSGANLTNLDSRYPPESSEESEFISKFNGCSFHNAKFNNSKIQHCGFSATNFNDSDFSGASIHSNFIGCYFSRVKFNKETNLSRMTFANDYEKSHTLLTPATAERTRVLMMDLDEALREIFLRDNPEVINL